MMTAEERLKILRAAKPESWIAFTADESKVVASGDTYLDTVSRAAEAGEPEPILVKIPEDWTPRIL